MLRPRFIWIIFALCVAVVSAAMGWMTHTTLRFERAETQAVRQSDNERLALWRLDSAVVPLIAQESARPPDEYQSFTPARDAYSVERFSRIRPGEVQVPSSLLAHQSPWIRLHFMTCPSGETTSPQVPDESLRDEVLANNYSTAERIESCSIQLQELKSAISWVDLETACVKDDPLRTLRVPAALDEGEPPTPPEFGNYIEQQLGQSLQAQTKVQSQRSIQELQRRGRSLDVNLATNSGQPQQAVLPGPLESPTAIEAGGGSASAALHERPMRAVWQADALLLIRHMTLSGGEVIQGCLLDWPQIRQALLEEIRDLLPEARLTRAPIEAGSSQQLMMASLPVRLTPGAVPAVVLPFWTPMRISLAIAWVGLLAAAAAVAALLLAAVRLSERRGAFVSAVTHELRTPLTTFQLYTEMLSEGRVTTDEKRRSYLETLRVEAGRLGHLVDNVLSYARLDGRRARAARDTIDVADLLNRASETLRDRASQHDMAVEIACPNGEPLAAVGDAAAVERIVFNLVDNAAKYANGAADRRIHVAAARAGRRVEIRVRDHGAGITRRQARRLFRPFSKSATEAAHSAPGVGLGLALSRRLARSQGGELKIDHAAKHGACFVLSLPGR